MSLTELQRRITVAETARIAAEAAAKTAAEAAESAREAIRELPEYKAIQDQIAFNLAHLPIIRPTRIRNSPHEKEANRRARILKESAKGFRERMDAILSDDTASPAIIRKRADDLMAEINWLEGQSVFTGLTREGKRASAAGRNQHTIQRNAGEEHKRESVLPAKNGYMPHPSTVRPSRRSRMWFEEQENTQKSTVKVKTLDRLTGQFQ
jgi:hypothetical protein